MQTRVKEGKRDSEADFAVGYSSPAQFSRKYEKRFGFSPSATGAASLV
jgi:AraC-like DNA-binding protein